MTMKLPSLVRLATIACCVAVAVQDAPACSCGGFTGRTAWEGAQRKAQNAPVIFEGVPEHFQWQWSILNAKDGDLIPADAYPIGQGRAHWPRMVVTFRVQRVYKGNLGEKVDVTTGIVTADCSERRFATRETYLVYGFGVGLCSPGGSIGQSELATELRYLRKEQPIQSDLVGIRSLFSDSEKTRARIVPSFRKICGTILRQGAKVSDRETVAFLSAAGYSPYEFPSAEVNQDRSFCSDNLEPGKYYLYFTGSSGGRLTSAGYYPAINDRSKAQMVEISAGQTQSSIVIKVPSQEGRRVHGLISINDKSGLTPSDVRIELIRLDGAPSEAWYEQAVDFTGSFPMPRVKYFHFDSVLPGRYMAYVSVAREGWYTKKVQVNVSAHMKFLLLELSHRR
jgi:hypothetical protein